MKKLFIILLSAMTLTAVAQNDVKRVAILETVDKMGTVPYLKQLMFRSNLTTAITNTIGYEGYDRADLKEILGEQNFQRTGLVSDADIKKIGEFTGAKYVLIAEAVIDGSDMFITAKIIDVETARVLRNSNQLMGTSAAEMQSGSQKVAADLLGVPSSSSSRQVVAASAPQSTTPKSSVTPQLSSTAYKTSTSKTADGYVDLGLPSGTLWKAQNEPCGLITHDKAMSMYGSNLPTKEQFEELINSCVWTWTGEGYNVMGPNKEMIFFPVGGFRNGTSTLYKKHGFYWSSTPADTETIIHDFYPKGCTEKEKAKLRQYFMDCMCCMHISSKSAVVGYNSKDVGHYVRLVK